MFNETGSQVQTSEMAASAEAVSLRYCNDAEPGFRRVRAGKLFDYRTATGNQLRDEKHLDRIRALVIPPAWTEVWIAPHADCHIQATGRDARGRKQYRYHERWTACRDEAKYGNLVEFAHTLPKLRKAIDSDLGKRGLPRDKVLATVVWLLDNVMIRVGNSSYARDNKSFGLTTLRDRHADISGSTLKFSFKGKSGKEWNVKVSDRRIARIVKNSQDLPGQQLFQYVDEDGQRRAISSADVNGYIRENAGDAFSSKHFRTWGGTVLAAAMFASVELPETKVGTNRARNEVIDAVARQLGNTRAVCRKCYIHPRIFESWEDGALTSDLATIRNRHRRTPSGLSREETIVLKWLETAKHKRSTRKTDRSKAT
jgi:DNA topoisomerase-1